MVLSVTINSNFFKKNNVLIFNFICIGLLPTCMSDLCKGVGYPGLELQTFVNCHAGAGS